MTMRPPGIEPEYLLARLTAVNLALQALIERLLLAGIIDPDDLVTMRDVGLQLAADLQAHGSSLVQISGEKVESEVRSFWEAMGTP